MNLEIQRVKDLVLQSNYSQGDIIFQIPYKKQQQQQKQQSQQDLDDQVDVQQDVQTVQLDSKKIDDVKSSNKRQQNLFMKQDSEEEEDSEDEINDFFNLPQKFIDEMVSELETMSFDEIDLETSYYFLYKYQIYRENLRDQKKKKLSSKSNSFKQKKKAKQDWDIEFIPSEEDQKNIGRLIQQVLSKWNESFPRDLKQYVNVMEQNEVQTFQKQNKQLKEVNSKQKDTRSEFQIQHKQFLVTEMDEQKYHLQLISIQQQEIQSVKKDIESRQMALRELEKEENLYAGNQYNNPKNQPLYVNEVPNHRGDIQYILDLKEQALEDGFYLNKKDYQEINKELIQEKKIILNDNLKEEKINETEINSKQKKQQQQINQNQKQNVDKIDLKDEIQLISEISQIKEDNKEDILNKTFDREKLIQLNKEKEIKIQLENSKSEYLKAIETSNLLIKQTQQKLEKNSNSIPPEIKEKQNKLINFYLNKFIKINQENISELNISELDIKLEQINYIIIKIQQLETEINKYNLQQM